MPNFKEYGCLGLLQSHFWGLQSILKFLKKNHTWSHMVTHGCGYQFDNCGGSVRRAGRVRRDLRFLLMKTNDWG